MKQVRESKMLAPVLGQKRMRIMNPESKIQQAHNPRERNKTLILDRLVTVRFLRLLCHVIAIIEYHLRWMRLIRIALENPIFLVFFYLKWKRYAHAGK